LNCSLTAAEPKSSRKGRDYFPESLDKREQLNRRPSGPSMNIPMAKAVKALAI
jgi:hypothetical protein